MADEQNDPNLSWDGTRWLRWNGSVWTDATTGVPVSNSGLPSAPVQVPAKSGVGKTYPDKQDSDICANAAGTVQFDGLTVTATPLKPVTDPTWGKALCSNVTITNNSGKTQDYNVFNFKTQTPSGVVDTGSSTNLASIPEVLTW